MNSAHRSLHQLVTDVIARGARTQEESRLAGDRIQESTAALVETVAAIERARADRTRALRFGNGQADARGRTRPG
jgi:hypothetical protein